MTVQAFVTVTFQAADEAEAEATVNAWTLHEGSLVQLTINSVRSGVADADGGVSLELPALTPPPMPEPVVAAFTYTPTAPSSNQAVTFDASTSTGAITTYDWDWGDGTAAPDGGVTPTHTYSKKGDSIVTLTVADGFSVNTTSQTVTVA